MKEPDHKVKRHTVPFSNKQKPYWSEHTVHGWLGSGLTDCNGVEIFEGDIVKFGDGEIFTVTVEDGCFYVGDNLLGDFHFPPEIVGHIAEEGET